MMMTLGSSLLVYRPVRIIHRVSEMLCLSERPFLINFIPESKTVTEIAKMVTRLKTLSGQKYAWFYIAFPFYRQREICVLWFCTVLVTINH